MTGVHVISASLTESPPLDNVQPSFPPDGPPHAPSIGAMSYDTVGGTTSSGHDDSDAGDLPNIEALISTPLPPGKTLIIYHPHAQHSPEVIDTDTLSLTREPQPSLPPSEPWAPFTSRDDFEQAEFFIKHNCTNKMVNDQLHLNQKRDLHNHGPGDLPSMRNAYEMHKIFEEAVSDLDISSVCGFLQIHHHITERDQFKQVSIEVPYTHSGTEDKRTYIVHCRSSLDAILDLIQDPDIHPSFTFYPEHHYVLNPRTKKNMRVWTDIHTGDDWWELQVWSTS